MRTDVIAIAHRGYSARFPECTRLSYERAIDIGVDFIEIDVMRTRDGRFVIFHAGDLAQVSTARGRIGEKTFGELSEVNIIGGSQGEFGFQPIPPLEDILSLARASGVRVCAEMKDVERGDIKGYVEDVMSQFRDTGMTDRMVVNTGNAAFIEECRRSYPEVPIAVDLAGGRNGVEDLDGCIRRLLSAGVQIVQFDFRHMTVDRVHALRCSGLAVWAWTLNREEDMRTAIEMGVDAILTDDPRMLRDLQARLPGLGS